MVSMMGGGKGGLGEAGGKGGLGGGGGKGGISPMGMVGNLLRNSSRVGVSVRCGVFCAKPRQRLAVF